MCVLACKSSRDPSQMPRTTLRDQRRANKQCRMHYPPPPCVRLHRVAVSLRGPGRSPVLPFACCVETLHFVGRCGRCFYWRRFRIRGAQWSVCLGLCWLCAGALCSLAVPSSWRTGGCAGGYGGHLTGFAAQCTSALRSSTTCFAVFSVRVRPRCPTPPCASLWPNNSDA